MKIGIEMFWCYIKIWALGFIVFAMFLCACVEGCARVKASYNYLTTGKILEEDSND